MLWGPAPQNKVAFETAKVSNGNISNMKNYIELMKIRISDNVKIDVNFNIPQNSPTKIAPLLFITLIENAFKHGISYSFPSFINIQLEEHAGTGR